MELRKRVFGIIGALAVGMAFDTASATSGPPPDIRVKGKTPWVVLLCKFADRPTVEPPRFLYEFVLSGNVISNYWRDVSYGAIDLSGSVVKGWYQTELTTSEDKTIDRFGRIKKCIDAANDVRFPDFYGIIAVYNDIGQDEGHVHAPPLTLNGVSKTYGLVLSNQRTSPVNNKTVTFLTHEMGHGYGLPDSASAWPWAGYGDRSDLMSAMNVDAGSSGPFCPCGPRLNGHHLDRLGWLPSDRIQVYPGGTAVYELAPLGSPDKAGPLMVKVPIKDLLTGGVPDPFHYYTIEMRRKAGWDSGIARSGVVIHEIVSEGWAAGWSGVVLMNDGNYARPVGDSFEESWGRFTVTVDMLGDSVAKITVRDLPPPPAPPTGCRPSVGCDGFVTVYCNMVDAIVRLDRLYPNGNWIAVSTDNDRWRYHIPFIGTSGFPGDNMTLRACSINAAGDACTNPPMTVNIPSDLQCGGGGPSGDPRSRCHRERDARGQVIVVCPPRPQ